MNDYLMCDACGKIPLSGEADEYCKALGCSYPAPSWGVGRLIYLPELLRRIALVPVRIASIQSYLASRYGGWASEYRYDYYSRWIQFRGAPFMPNMEPSTLVDIVRAGLRSALPCRCGSVFTRVTDAIAHLDKCREGILMYGSWGDIHDSLPGPMCEDTPSTISEVTGVSL